MSRYEQRLARDKGEIRRRVSRIGERVGEAVAASVEALLNRDEAACARIMLGDLPINREIRAIDKACHAFVARHLPSAGHLRFVSSVLQMNVALERIGDYAVTIAREGVQLTEKASAPFDTDLRALSGQACTMLAQAMKAFAEQDVDLARKTKPESKAVERTYGQLYRHLVEQGTGRPLADAFALLTVFHRLERVGDQAKNICEETLFELTGETKPPKRYKVLFVGVGDTLMAPLAVALARKAFPESGDYSSAGYAPGQTLSPELESLSSELSLDVSGITPTPLDTDRDALEKYHVIVCLSQDARRHLTAIPYATAVLVWNLPRLSDAPGESLGPRLQELCRNLGAEISELMETLRGDAAS